MNAYLRSLLIFFLFAIGLQAAAPVAGAGSRPAGEPEIAFVGPVLPEPEPEAVVEEVVPAPEPAGADTASAAAPQAMPQETEAWGSGAQFPMFRTLGGMGVVIFLMAAVYLAARKMAPRYFNKPEAKRTLKVLETLPMGDKRSISLIQVDGSRFLVGNTPQQISVLVSLPAAAPAPVSAPQPSPAPEPPKIAERKENRVPFRNIFEVEKKRPVPQPANPLPPDLRSKMQQLREALERS